MSDTNINLSERMKAVVSMVERSINACDIGCDHGYVSIALVSEGRAKHVIASDVNEGPLAACKENVNKSGYNEFIDVRLGDGLHKITPEDKIDTIIVAGMGGQLMAKILSESLDIVKSASLLVLQPQSEQFLVRRFLRDNGFYIRTEKMVKEAGKYYWIIRAQKGTKNVVDDEIQDIFDKYSGYLITSKDPLLWEYLNKKLEVSNGYLQGIKDGEGDELRKTIGEITTALNLMQ